MDIKKVIYELDLFEEVNYAGYYITRVPGGWIFSTNRGSTCFVPFNNEFMEYEKQ